MSFLYFYRVIVLLIFSISVVMMVILLNWFHYLMLTCVIVLFDYVVRMMFVMLVLMMIIFLFRSLVAVFFRNSVSIFAAFLIAILMMMIELCIESVIEVIVSLTIRRLSCVFIEPHVKFLLVLSSFRMHCEDSRVLMIPKCSPIVLLKFVSIDFELLVHLLALIGILTSQLLVISSTKPTIMMNSVNGIHIISF